MVERTAVASDARLAEGKGVLGNILNSGLI